MSDFESFIEIDYELEDKCKVCPWIRDNPENVGKPCFYIYCHDDDNY